MNWLLGNQGFLFYVFLVKNIILVFWGFLYLTLWQLFLSSFFCFLNLLMVLFIKDENDENKKKRIYFVFSLLPLFSFFPVFFFFNKLIPWSNFFFFKISFLHPSERGNYDKVTKMLIIPKTLMQVLERYQYFCVMNRSKYTMDLTMPVIIYFLSLFILLVFLCCLRISYKYIQVSASSSKELTSFIVNHYRWKSMIEVPVRDLQSI